MSKMTDAQYSRLKRTLNGGTIAQAFPPATPVQICTDDEWCNSRGIAGQHGTVDHVHANNFVLVSLAGDFWTVAPSCLVKEA